MTIRLRPLCEALGAEVCGLDLRRELGGDEAETLYRAWLDHGCLLFRDQRLSLEAQLCFAALFGPVEPVRGPEEGAPGAARVRYVANRPVEGGGSILPDGAMQLHSDYCYRERPYKATLLYALEVPAGGGETLFADARRAYDTLPADLKAQVAGLQARHAYADQDIERPPSFSPQAQTHIHPVVVRHPESGRALLFVNRLMTADLVGLDEAASEALLERLFDHIEQPALVYAHEWRDGDLLIWDNLALLHGRRDFDPETPRVLRRLTISGEQPVAVDAR